MNPADDCDIKVFCCPKLGNSREEYEDAWAHRQTRTPAGIRVAVADGATESSYAKLGRAFGRELCAQ